MSFSFSAVGTKEEVIAQLAKIDVYGNDVGEAAKTLVSDSLGKENVQPYSGYEYKYTVTANGHSGGGSPLSLNLSVVGHYVPVVTAEEPPVEAQTPEVDPAPVE